MTSFDQFWPFYLGEHLDPLNRKFHVVGTVAAVATVVTVGVLASLGMIAWWWILAALVVGYGPAWVGHFFIERNRPASFGNPYWSLIADFRLAWFELRGALPVEAARVGARCRF